MPAAIKKKFIEKYGKKKGEEIYYKTVNKQNRDPETFKAKKKQKSKPKRKSK
jgi:hypothetical protein